MAAATAAAQESIPQNGRSPQKAADAGLQGPGPLQAPGSQTVLTAADVEAMGITSLYGVAYGVPGLTLTPTAYSSNTPVLYMRGLGLDNPSQLTRDGAAAVYEDGFLIARQQALTFDLLDLDHVEVLSGPQGALYGRDTTGGVLNLISQAPAGELRLQQHADFGNRNMFRVLASLDTPQWHGLSAKVTLLASSIDGYVRNPQPFSHDYGEERERAGRLQLHWDALSSLQADYSLQKSNLDSTPAYLTNPFLNGQSLYSFFYPYYANPSGPTTTSYRPVDLPLSTSNHVTHHLTLAWTPSGAFTIRSLTGYRTLGAEQLQDYAEAVGIAETTVDNYNPRQFSQELQLTGSLFDQQIGYTLGGSYFRERGWHDRFYGFATLGRGIQHTVLAQTRSEAAYVEFQWRPDFLRKRLELTAAARGTRDVKEAERFRSIPGRVSRMAPPTAP
jgi:iron complex outermembrane receptor protein